MVGCSCSCGVCIFSDVCNVQGTIGIHCYSLDTPLRNQAMVGPGDPEATQVRFSEALFPAASLAKTTMSWGSTSKVGGVPVTAQEQRVSASTVSKNVTFTPCS